MKLYSQVANQSVYPFVLPELPYHKYALSPYISEDLIELHYNKHHGGYVSKLNDLVAGTKYKDFSLESIIIDTFEKPDLVQVFNNAGQVWNHTFYWHSMTHGGGGHPGGELYDDILSTFNSFSEFIDSFKLAANHFGSAWVWLVLDSNNQLAIRSTGNANNPITSGEFPIIVCDVWEHAYYIDYKNLRIKYVETFLEKIVNWEFASDNYMNAKML